MAEGTGGEIGAITVKGATVRIGIIIVEGTLIIAAGAGIMMVIAIATVLMVEASLTLPTTKAPE